MARDCLKLYVEEKKKLGSLLRGNVGLKENCLDFFPVSSYGGVDIGKVVETCLLKWGIESNVFTIFIDNATTNDPRNKLEYVEVLLGDIYGKVKGKTMCGMIKASLVELYEDYFTIHASPELDTLFTSI
ncbi:hypothetical protein Tco_1020643, partial [Tanacetum coccineum]